MDRRRFLASTAAVAVATTGAGKALEAQTLEPRVSPVLEGLSHPWGLGLLPDGAGLISQRDGQLLLVEGLTKNRSDLRPVRISGLPKLKATGQGGLLDVQPLPDFTTSGEIVFAASVADITRKLSTEIFRARLSGSRLTNVSRIFVCEPKSRGGRHFGCRIRFDETGALVFALGDRGERDRARDLTDDAGKVHRITVDGLPASGNPYLGAIGGAGDRAEDQVRETIYASGTRNAQGMAVHPATQEIWFHEHGPRGGDEVNLLQGGADYGWPKTTHGRAYTGGKIGVGPEALGVTAPLWVWVPSIAPSGMDFWLGSASGAVPFGDSIFVGALAGRVLVRLTISPQVNAAGEVPSLPTTVLAEERYLENLSHRIREVRTLYADDGKTPQALLLLTDAEQGACWRVTF